ncbi:hypothetical protein [Bacillus massiliglaciei]|uniref:hypothetical protein n=1 Tax=Bacillus massiliglaciei TaxID=1816693 RepID=UPI0018FE329F|nr:hypothetical protein [Bacillus massiliglaciei]
MSSKTSDPIWKDSTDNELLSADHTFLDSKHAKARANKLIKNSRKKHVSMKENSH